MGIAQTGTGKTLAFGVPLITRVSQTNKGGLVVVPTRELALQVEETIARLSRDMGLHTAVLIGGTSMYAQVQAIRRGADIIIATPGRLIDHLEQKTLTLNNVGVVVLDEADRMLDMGFMPQIRRIFDVLPLDRQTMVFSATMPPEITRIASSHMKLPVRVEMAPAGTTAERVTQELFIVPRERKLPLLANILNTSEGATIVFTKTKHGAKRIVAQIRALGIKAAEIHSNRTLHQRREALEGFKTGRYRVLVATDIASRGIDVSGIACVVNYDMPSNADDYVHRIGRTARAGAEGHAITFALPFEQREVRTIERLTRKQIPVSPVPHLEALPAHVQNAAPKFEAEPRRPRSFSRSAPRARTPHRGPTSGYRSRSR
jgi:ATP-dependent RNA helicase RhlE